MNSYGVVFIINCLKTDDKTVREEGTTHGCEMLQRREDTHGICFRKMRTNTTTFGEDTDLCNDELMLILTTCAPPTTLDNGWRYVCLAVDLMNGSKLV